MLLTSQMLRDEQACAHWQAVFDYRFPNGLVLETKQDLANAIRFSGMGPVLDWFLFTFVGRVSHLRNDAGKLDLTDCNFDNAVLMGLSCRHVDFSRSSFRSTKLHFSKFEKCVFKDVKLQFSVLCNSRILSCDFTNANLTNAYAYGTYFHNSSLTAANLAIVEVDDKTEWYHFSEPMPKEFVNKCSSL